MRRALVGAPVLAAALSAGAAAAGGVGISASPVRLLLTGNSTGAVTVRNPSARPLLVDVSRAGFGRSLRGRPLIRPAPRSSRWLHVRPRRLRLAPHGAAILHVTATPSRRDAPGDHPALVLLTTRPLGVRHVQVRLRLGVVVVLHVRGRIVRRLDLRQLTVHRRGSQRLLELRLVNRGNVTEELGGGRLRIVLLDRARTIATLRPRRRELLPHSAGIAEFVYGGPARGTVLARVELRSAVSGGRTFRIRL